MGVQLPFSMASILADVPLFKRSGFRQSKSCIEVLQSPVDEISLNSSVLNQVKD